MSRSVVFRSWFQSPGFRTRRRSLRRCVDVGCEVRSELWDGPVKLPVSDLSPEGMWVDTELPLDVGDEVLATFSPPGSCVRLHALCRVRRVALWRRAEDAGSSGMGLAFTDLTWHDRARLSRSLIGIPPPLPVEVRRRAAFTARTESPAGANARGALPPVLDCTV